MTQQGEFETSETRTGFTNESSIAVPEQQEGPGHELTRTAEMGMLILLIHTHPQAPGMVGECKKVLRLGRTGDGSSQPLQPLLALLEGGEMAPANPKANHPQQGRSPSQD